MKDPDDKSTADLLDPARDDRRARYRANKKAAGFRQVALWIHRESEQEGAAAAARGAPSVPQTPPDDLLSWLVGWAREKESEK